MSSIQLIVGLGNPGAEYEHTRHNAGVWFIQYIANETMSLLRHETKFQGFHCLTKINNQDCHLLVPTTFMNHSGQSVSTLARYYKIPAQGILIVHDEIDLPVADLRLKFNGGDGGHNGLKDIVRHLQTKEFYRLRIGIGHPGNSKAVHDYVLSSPKKTELDEIHFAFPAAYSALLLLLKGEYQKAMNQLHGAK